MTSFHDILSTGAPKTPSYRALKLLGVIGNDKTFIILFSLGFVFIIFYFIAIFANKITVFTIKLAKIPIFSPKI